MAVTKVDHTAIRFTQFWVVAFSLLAFITGASLLVLALALVLAFSAAQPEHAPFRQVYVTQLRPRGWLKPDVRADDPAPHRFAQAVGATVLGLSFILLAVGAAPAGWGLDLLVTFLAALNLTIGFCAGCFLFYQLRRLHLLPGSTVQL
jgi:hypothetical protein